MMGISRRNGAKQRPTLEILWTNSNVLRILGGPGRNRTRAEDAQSLFPIGPISLIKIVDYDWNFLISNGRLKYIFHP